MKRVITSLLAVASLVILAGCSSEYVISRTDGTLITTHSKPKLDEKTGMYVYEDEDGRKATVRKDDVKEILER